MDYYTQNIINAAGPGEKAVIIKHLLFVPWEIFHGFLSLLIIFKIIFFEIFFQEYHLSVKQIESRAGSTFGRA